MHNTFFTRFTMASLAVAPLTLVSALICIDGSHAGQSGQRDTIASPESTAQTEATVRPRPAHPQRPADPALDSLAHSADVLVFERPGELDDPSLALMLAVAPAGRDVSRHGGQDERAEHGRAGDLAAGLTATANAAPHGAMQPYGQRWIDAPQAAWNAGPAGATRAFAAPTAPLLPSPGGKNPTGGTGSPVTPQVFYATENPVTVLTTASPGATPTEGTKEPLALLAAPVIAARNATPQAIPEPTALSLVLGALALVGIGHRSKRLARGTA